MEIGYHASHEQFPPSELLRLTERAEELGFEAVLSSDHLAPWSRDRSEGGFAYAWLGAVAVRTRLRLGVVTAPGYRYHPAVVAQAVATVAELAPGRLTPALGSGQALNEHVTGEPWPDKPERNERLAECATVIRALLAGEQVDHDGRVPVRDAELFTLPPEMLPLFGAALTPESAAHVGRWADGLITVAGPRRQLEEVIGAFRSAAGDRPVHIQLHLSWAETDEQARAAAADNWRANALPPEKNEDLRTPADLDRATEGIDAADLEESVLMSADPGVHADRLAELADLGVERTYLHHVGRDQAAFLESYAERVLSRLR